LIIAVAISFSFGALPAFAKKFPLTWDKRFPPSWKKTMTNDPKTNPVLDSFLEKMTDPLAENIRVLKLIKIMGRNCNATTINFIALSNLEVKHIQNHSPDEIKDAELLAGMKFNYMTYQTVIHLCAGIQYMFGPKGALIKNGLLRASPEATRGPDDNNPYLANQSF
ncbi:MAG: hypothetical protein KGJ29_14800, partial [Hyphomicrobiales bacterium]|nr:hypothetical protein [Hyphomicrobiales bacterium]